MVAQSVGAICAAVHFNMASQQGQVYRSKLPSEPTCGELDGKEPESDCDSSSSTLSPVDSPIPTQSVVPRNEGASEKENAKGKFPPKV